MSSFLAHRADPPRKHEHLRSSLARASTLCAHVGTDTDATVLSLSLPQLVAACEDGSVTRSDVLYAYGRRALAAHEATNCLADIFFDEVVQRNESSASCSATLLGTQPPPDAPGCIKDRANASPDEASSRNESESDSTERTAVAAPLLSGVPVSIKDCIDVAGHDTTLGFFTNSGRPARADAPIVRLLRDAGALIYAKTTLPTACLSFECSSDLFGATTNPYNPAFSPGASTGGGASLLAWQGSMVELGTDIGGSVRYPAAYCGVYAVKGTYGRLPSTGCMSCTPGLEAVPTITAPLARTLHDLQEFWRRVVEMRPWEYDHTCAPIPWRLVDYVASGQKLRFGVLVDDGIIPPTPAAARALEEVASALRKQGHEVIPFSPPSPLEGLKIGYQLMFSDGAQSILAPRRSREFVNPALLSVRLMLRLPLWLKRLNATLLRWFSRPRGRNGAWASLLEVFHPCTAYEERRLVVERDAYRAAWHEAWHGAELDLLLTVPHALPAISREPAASDKATLVSANYAFLYNVLDCAAGVMPVTYIDEARDSLPAGYRDASAYQGMNDVARAIHDMYDGVSAAMHGMPVGVQVVGRRFEEERVLAGMRVIEHALWETGGGFEARRFSI